MRKKIATVRIVFIILLFLSFLQVSLPSFAIVHNLKPIKAKLNTNISKQKIINVTDEYYRGIVDGIQSSPSEYKGKGIIINGFVFKPDDGSLFDISRIFMYCCASDAQIIGLPVQWKNSSALKEGDWVKITGNIEINANDNKVYPYPFIKALKVEKIQPPKNQYVY